MQLVYSSSLCACFIAFIVTCFLLTRTSFTHKQKLPDISIDLEMNTFQTFGTNDHPNIQEIPQETRDALRKVFCERPDIRDQLLRVSSHAVMHECIAKGISYHFGHRYNSMMSILQHLNIALVFSSRNMVIGKPSMFVEELFKSLEINE